MCQIDYDETAEAYTSTWRKARKTHLCDACGAEIAAGARYYFGSGIFDGAPFSEKLCEPCGKTRDEFGKEHAYYPAAAELEERLVQCIDEEPESLPKWGPVLDGLRARGGRGPFAEERARDEAERRAARAAWKETRP